MERLGPGSRESTEKALAFFPRKSQPVRILDVGCGVGTHTFLLASHFPKADITAIDSHSPYIQTLNQSAAARGISDRVHGLEMSMFDMTFEKESFDLIWSEGAIYIIGFERGLKEWKRFLKPGGFQICSEISWLKDDPSRESLDFWQSAYPRSAPSRKICGGLKMPDIFPKVILSARSATGRRSIMLPYRKTWIA